MKIGTMNKEIYFTVFNAFVNKLTDENLTTRYFLQHGARCHRSNASMRGN
jgi:hypothetical protein